LNLIDLTFTTVQTASKKRKESNAQEDLEEEKAAVLNLVCWGD
jgi:hypothetical protein